MSTQSAANAKQAADDFAVNGLRTLIFAYRDISNEEFDDWAENCWNTARLATENRRQQLVAAAEVIEKNLTIIGTTGIEDRLQDAVPETITDLMKANIKVFHLSFFIFLCPFSQFLSSSFFTRRVSVSFVSVILLF
jgi:magnesium-transporting ATPase (P-type)